MSVETREERFARIEAHVQSVSLTPEQKLACISDLLTRNVTDLEFRLCVATIVHPEVASCWRH